MNEPGIKRVLTIAGSDSSAGAGVQLDLKIFERLGVYGMTAVTAVTAQDTAGVRKINSVSSRIIAAQIDAVARDIGLDACKIGMLYDPTAVGTVAGRINRREIPNVVLDPVLTAKRWNSPAHKQRHKADEALSDSKGSGNHAERA